MKTYLITRKLPFNKGRSGLFQQSQTTLEQAGSNIKNLLLTAKGERVMQPNFGSRLRELLFEQYTEDLSSRIQEEIQEAISTWLPYINIASVNIIQSDEDPNTYPQEPSTKIVYVLHSLAFSKTQNCSFSFSSYARKKKVLI